MALMQDPAANGIAVTPGDSTDIASTRGLYVGGAGDVAVLFKGGSASVTIAGVAAGTVLPFQVTRVYSTSTTATGIVALY
jgi:hypothetical protein